MKLLAALVLALAFTANVSASDVVVSSTQSTQIPFNPSNIGASRSITVTATNSSAVVTSSAAFPPNIVGKSGFTVTIGGVYYTVAGVASTSSLTLTALFTGSTGSATMVLFPYVLLRANATAGFQSSTLTSSTATVSVTNASQTVTSSAAFPSYYVGAAGGFQVLIGSQPYQVLSVLSTSTLLLSTPYGGSTGSATMTFDGIAENVQPSAPGSGNWYKEIAVSVVNAGSGNVLYYPSFVLPATTNALINNQARFVLNFYRTDNSLLAPFTCGSIAQLAIPTSTPTTLTALCNYNAPGGVVPPNTEVYTKTQIDQRFPSCTAGQSVTFTTSGNVLSCTNAGSGSVTSVGLSLPSIFTVTGSPVTSSGTLTGTLATQSANTVFAGPTSGGAATPAFRALVQADIPATALSQVRQALNVKLDYGCTGDGVANDQTCMANALTAAAAAGGKEVYVPAGTYLVTGLTVPGGVTLVGDGPLKSIIYSTTNAVIVDAVEGSGAYTFFGPKIRNLQIKGSVSAGSSQIGLKMDDGSYYFGAEVANVHIVDAGANALYVGNVYSSVWRNMYLDNSADYPLEYNANAMPGNIFESIYVGNLRASAPTAFRIRRGEFTCIGCNGVNNVVAASRWAAVGTKTGVDGDAGNFGATFDCYNCNYETWVGYGIYVYASSILNLRGYGEFAMDATGAGSGIPIYYENNGDGADYFSQFVRRGLIEDTVRFANTVSDYANSQPIHAVGFPAIETIGYGPAISGSEALSTYRNTSTSANVPLSRKDGKLDAVTVTSSTTYAQPGPRYIQANCAAACTVTLPWAGYYKIGELLIVKDISGAAATNNVTVSSGGGGTVNGSSYTIAQNGGAVILTPNDTATDWRVVGTANAAQPLTNTYVGFGSASNQLTGTANLTYDTGSKIFTLTAAGGNPYIAVNDSTNTITTRFGPLAGAPDRAIIGTTSNHPFVLYQNGAAGVGVDTSKHFVPYNASNAQDLGSTSALWRTLYAQTSVRVGLGSSSTGALVFLNSGNTNTLTFQAGTTGSNLTFTLPTADGSSGNCLQTNGSGVLSFAACAGSPGGSDTQVQRNNAGAFGGISGATSDGTNMTFGSANLRATRPRFTTSIDDTNGNEVFILTATGSAVNEVTIANAATGSNPLFTASGGDADVGINWLLKGAGTFNLTGNATQAAELRLFEDTDNGTNYTAFKVGTQAGNITYTLPTADGSSGHVLQTNGSGVLSWAAASGGAAWNAITNPSGNQSLDMSTHTTTWTANTAITNTVNTLLTIGHNTSGTAAASFGTRTLYKLESSTTADRDAAAVDVIWTTATDASRTSAMPISLVASAAALAEVARFTGAGNLLMGTTSATPFFGKGIYLNNGAGYGEIALDGSNGGLLVFAQSGSSKWYQQISGGTDLAFVESGAATRLRLRPGGDTSVVGKLYVGADTSPTSTLHVVSQGASTVPSIVSSAATPSVDIARFQINGTTAAAVTKDGDIKQTQVTGSAATTQGTLQESITLNTGGATTDSTIDLPANSIILSVTARITTSIAGVDSTALQVGDPTTATRFGSTGTLTAGTTVVGLNQMQGGITTDATGPVQVSTAKVRLTLAGGADNTPSAGVVRITIHYLSLTAPTS